MTEIFLSLLSDLENGDVVPVQHLSVVRLGGRGEHEDRGPRGLHRLQQPQPLDREGVGVDRAEHEPEPGDELGSAK